MSLAYMDFYIFIGMILSAVIISVIYRVYIIKSWIEHYCKYDLRSALPEAAPVPIEGPIPVTRTVDFTWEPSLWFKNYNKRAGIITACALTAFNEYDRIFNLLDKNLLLHISIKAVKKSCFEHGLGMCTNYITPRWGGEISITFVDKPVEKPIEKPVQKLTKEVPRIRQIMVCKNV